MTAAAHHQGFHATRVSPNSVDSPRERSSHRPNAFPYWPGSSGSSARDSFPWKPFVEAIRLAIALATAFFPPRWADLLNRRTSRLLISATRVWSVLSPVTAAAVAFRRGTSSQVPPQHMPRQDIVDAIRISTPKRAARSTHAGSIPSSVITTSTSLSDTICANARCPHLKWSATTTTRALCRTSA